MYVQFGPQCQYRFEYNVGLPFYSTTSTEYNQIDMYAKCPTCYLLDQCSVLPHVKFSKLDYTKEDLMPVKEFIWRNEMPFTEEEIIRAVDIADKAHEYDDWIRVIKTRDRIPFEIQKKLRAIGAIPGHCIFVQSESIPAGEINMRLDIDTNRGVFQRGFSVRRNPYTGEIG